MGPYRYSALGLILLLVPLVLAFADASKGSGPLPPTSDNQVPAATLTRLLQDLQELAATKALKPEQRAEIKSLLSRARLLRQKLTDSSPDVLPPGYQEQLEEIKLRLDAIKKTLPSRPRNLKKYRSAVA